MTSSDQTFFKTVIPISTRNPDRNGLRSILVVDDEPEQILIIKKILTSAGYRVLEAETGAQCTKLIRSERPDLVLLDVNLPDANGLDICTQIKADPDISDTHIMFLSGQKTSHQEQARGLRAGADGYMVKPVHKEEFLARVEAIMRTVQNEEKLRESEEKHRSLFETMTQGVVHHAADGNIISANPAAEKILGLSLDQMRGKMPVNTRWRLTKEDGPEISKADHPALVALRTGKTIGPVALGLFNPDKNSHIWLSITAIPLFQPGETKPYQVYATFEDITDRKRAEETLAKQKQIMAQAEELAELGSWEWDIVNDTWHFSDNWVNIHGCVNPPLTSSQLIPIGYPEDRPAIEHAFAKVVEEGKPYDIEHRIVRQDTGEIRYVHARGVADFDDSGKPKVLAGAVQDITARKQTDRQTQEAHQRLLTVMDAMDHLIYIADMQTHELLFINAYGRRIFGDAASKKCWEVIQSGQTGPCAFCNNDKLLDAHGQPAGIHRWEFQNTTTRRWYECRDQAIPWTAGRFVRMEVAVDITERKQSEEHIRKLSMAVEQSPVSIVITDPLANIEYVNAAFTRVTGYAFDEVIGQNPRVLKSPDRKSEDYKEMWTTLTSGKKWHGEFKNIKKNGDVFWETASIAPISNEQGRTTHYVAVKENITQRKQVEAKLLEMNMAVEQSGDGIALADLDGHIRFVNRSWAELHGYTVEEVMGQHFSISHTPEQMKKEALPFNERVFAQGTNIGEVWHVHKDGSTFPMHMRVTIVKDANGKPFGMLAAARDITEQKKAEEELRTAKIKAQEATRAKSEFLANMSHEIRTPMNGVIGMTELLLDTELSAEQQSLAQSIQSSGEALLALINDILDFSKIEAGRLELENIDFDLHHLLEDIVSLMAVRAHEKGLEIICMPDPDVPAKIQGDPGRLRQILTNLIGNAIKFTSKGEVVIRVARQQGAEENPGMPETGSTTTLLFTISDTGIGIPEGKIQNLFSKFSQVDTSTTRQFGGTGLGLAISRDLAAMMGGEAGVESVYGQGSKFWFTACFARQKTCVTQVLVIPGDLQNRHILMVDDNDTNRRILKSQLKAWGARVEEASGGHNAQ